MAKFVIAGRADCPYYAKAELLADYLQKNIPDFQVFKIMKHPNTWEDWLKAVCKENDWDHSNSPIIWRELLDRGGRGLLLGGYNEFMEHAQLYYGVSSNMSTEMMMVIAQENLETCIADIRKKKSMKDVINPLQVWVTSAASFTCYNLIPLLLSGEVFGKNTKISLTLFDNEHMNLYLRSLVMETQDLASPVLRRVSFCTRLERAFLNAQVVIILDDSAEKEVLSLEDSLRSKVPLCRLYGYLLERNAQEYVKVIVAGKTFVNLKTVLLMEYAPRIVPNTVAVALGLEGQAKATVARKLKTAASCIKDVIVWGNISGNNYIDLRKAMVYNYESAICGPPQYAQPVLNMIFDSEWVQKEFVETLKTLTSTGKHFGGILAAHSIATTLKYWYHGSPPGEIVSLGILSKGEFGIPAGIVFSMPVKFEDGTWVVRTDLKNTEIQEHIMAKITNDLIQERLVALGDLVSFQLNRTENELSQKHEKSLLNSKICKLEKPNTIDVSEQKDNTNSSITSNEGNDPAKSDDSKDKNQGSLTAAIRLIPKQTEL